MPCRPGTQYSLPTQVLGTPGYLSIRAVVGTPAVIAHGKSTQEAHSRGGGVARGLECREMGGGSGPWPAPREPRWERGVRARQDAPRPPREKPQGAAPSVTAHRASGAGSAASDPFLERHPAPRTPGGARAALTWRTGRCHAPAGCGSPPASSAGSARAPGAPCSPRGHGAQGWDPRSAGTVTARAAPSPRRRGHSAPPAAPAPRPGPRGVEWACGWSSHRCFPAQVEPPPPARRFQGPRLPAAVPCAPPRAARLGLFKASAAPAPLRPDRRASPGDRLWTRTWRLGKGQGFRASRKSPSLWGPRFLLR